MGLLKVMAHPGAADVDDHIFHGRAPHGDGPGKIGRDGRAAQGTAGQSTTAWAGALFSNWLAVRAAISAAAMTSVPMGRCGPCSSMGLMGIRIKVRSRSKQSSSDQAISSNLSINEAPPSGYTFSET